MGHTAVDTSPLDRAEACLLGQLAGDNLGALVEFEDAATIRRRYPGGISDMADGGVWDILAGQPTDDSELALALARSLIAESEFDDEAVAAAYARWYASAPFDIGRTTALALGAAHRAAPGARLAAIARAASRESQANGSLMRVSPIGIAAAGDPGKAADWARRDSRLSHPHPICQAACAAYCAAIAVAIAGGDRAAMREAALAHADDDAAGDQMRAVLAEARRAPPADMQHQMGWVVKALHNAFFHLAADHGVERAIVDTVLGGGDSDTNAAIVGALIGAADGRRTLPERWVAPILACRPSPGSGTGRPRPQEYWPSDALEIARALLALSGLAFDREN